ncbi:MAG TPA: amino acid permease [Acidimicrobiia bacterium]|nr:amino acid permease [Acidimicrobiia bacterium]
MTTTEQPVAAPELPRSAPTAIPLAVTPPEPRLYRVKNRLLGPALATSQLPHERLGKPTALAVFASDNLSSSAYATEEILRVLLPVVGIAAFAMVVPITIALLVVLAFLILSYLQTIKAYPTAGGAYIVTRDNFGLLPAQVAGVALLTDYVLTVAVSVAAGTAALASAFSGLTAYTVPISIAFVVLIAYGNLRGVRESGRLFATPTYFFIGNMVLLLGIGFVKMFLGNLPVDSLHHSGLVNIGSPSSGLFYGATLYVVLHAFASGGAAVTGVEAISNGVPAFREPSWKNARITLVIMGSTLGAMFLGLSILASRVHPGVYENGTPTVISQIGKAVYGGGAMGNVLFYALQAGTMLILVLAANTSFADFPRLASFHAEDNFMPRQLTKRGHRLVFSNGIIFLAATAIVVLLITGAEVSRLIPLYAIGVFTSFTLSQAGMAKHHLTHREPHWHYGLLVNGIGAALSALVCIVIAVTKFAEGAWFIILLVPIMVAGLVRLNRQYEDEAEELKEDAPRIAKAPILKRHAVFVLIDQLDAAASRAIQYARTLTPDDLRAVHFDLDPIKTEDLSNAWRELGLARLPLDIVECPDRRIPKAAAELVASALANGETEVSVLIPRRQYTHVWHRLLHDRTANAITEALAGLPHANVTIVPYHLGSHPRPTGHSRRHELAKRVLTPVGRTGKNGKNGNGKAAPDAVGVHGTLPDDRVRIADLAYRQRARVAGRVSSVRVHAQAGVGNLECTLTDETGGIVLVFLGRKNIAGIAVGTRLVAEGAIGEDRGHLAMLNPLYQILPDG